jgi:hypothetical protein
MDAGLDSGSNSDVDRRAGKATKTFITNAGITYSRVTDTSVAYTTITNASVTYPSITNAGIANTSITYTAVADTGDSPTTASASTNYKYFEALSAVHGRQGSGISRRSQRMVKSNSSDRDAG